jgi:hypothetical protein
MKMTLAAVIAATAAVGLPASASGKPPIDAPPGSTCTFARGVTTCVKAFGFGTEGVVEVDHPNCPSGRAEHQTETITIERTITVFRGTHQLGDPRAETETTRTETQVCI